MATRNGSGNTLTFDAENRLTQAISGTVTSSFAYDGDSARVKCSDGTTTTYYVGNYFEVTNTGAVTKYYYFGAQRVAVRTSGGVTYLHSDHQGSSNVASNASGALVSRQAYYTFGVMRANDAVQIAW